MRGLRFAKAGRPPRSKFSNRPLRCQGGHLHQSTLEARRCNELTLMEQGGLIRDLEQQPRFRLDVNGQHICSYVADWKYWDNERGAEIVEDSKGLLTEVCKFKLRLMAAVHGVNVELVRKAGSRGWR